MKLLTKALKEKLLKNSLKMQDRRRSGNDMVPVVKFFNPTGAATWLISEMDEDGMMFGLCDLGFGCPELGYVSFEELSSVRVAFGLGIERDLYWEPNKTLVEYADEASAKGHIAA